MILYLKKTFTETRVSLIFVVGNNLGPPDIVSNLWRRIRCWKVQGWSYLWPAKVLVFGKTSAPVICEFQAISPQPPLTGKCSSYVSIHSFFTFQIYTDLLIDWLIDEGNGAMVSVQAEPAALWETAFHLKEGDAITTQAFSVQKASGCATGSDWSLSSSHLTPAGWCSSHPSGNSDDSWPHIGCVHKRLVRASARPELAHGVCCLLFPHLLHQELSQSFDEKGKFQRWNLFVRVLGAC